MHADILYRVIDADRDLNVAEAQPMNLVIAHGEEFDLYALNGIDASSELEFKLCLEPSLDRASEVAVVVLDRGQLALIEFEQWRKNYRYSVIVSAEGDCSGADLNYPKDCSPKVLLKLLKFACDRWAVEKQNRQMLTAIAEQKDQLMQMSQIGIALSSERDLRKLLDKILAEGRRIAHCDAASLYLIDDEQEGERRLIFKLAQNYSIDVPFEEMSMPLSDSSIAGYTCLKGEEVDLPNAYDIPANAPYGFNRSFDESSNYRTVNVLAIPMRNHRNEVIGALQFINCKKFRTDKLLDPRIIPQQVISFTNTDRSLLRALASQAAISLQNNELLQNINRLFEGFVQASVTAIEQRDPTTSGHSFRVADTTTALAEVVSRCDDSQYRKINYNENQLKEIRYASLLHDFGKVGVRENVLIKSKKLEGHRLDLIRHRIALHKERLQNQALNRQLKLMREGASSSNLEAKLMQINTDLSGQLAVLEDYMTAIIAANEPTVLSEGNFEHLHALRSYEFGGIDGQESIGLISQDELLALSVRRGSLSEGERKEIESHVSYTIQFLQMLPWTPELKHIPEYAGAHHEKLNGGGYPLGLNAQQIPLPAKMMAICDIYDALTAMDRPYKAAMPRERALSIIEAESSAGLIDNQLVELFISAKIDQVVKDKSYSSLLPLEQSLQNYAHHVCDPDIDH